MKSFRPDFHQFALEGLFEHLNPGGAIEMEEVQVSDKYLIAVGASSSIVLAAHNKSTGMGLLGHFGAVDHPNFNAPFVNAMRGLPDLGDPQHIRLWLGGGAPRPEPPTTGVDPIIKRRHVAVSTIRRFQEEHGLKPGTLKVEWSKPDKMADIGLFCKAGMVAVKHYDR